MSGLLIERLSKSCREGPLMDGVSLAVEPGRVLALTGAHGCGKSALLRIVAGIEAPDTGNVFVGGRDVTTEPVHRRGVAYVPQVPALWPHMSVRDNVAFGPESLQWPEAEVSRWVAEVLAAFDIQPLARRRPSTLSTGEAMRVSLARAVALRPEVLLLDAPLAGFDVASRARLTATLRALCRDNRIAAVWATAEPSEVFAVADDLAVMSGGRIVRQGDPAELRRWPGDRQVAELLGEANFISGRIIRAGAGEFLAETVFGEIRGALPDHDREPAAGDPITLMIRPECLKLDEYAPDENAFGGAVTDRIFFGDRALLRFEVPHAGVLKVLESNPRAERSPDDTVFAWVLPEDVVGLES